MVQKITRASSSHRPSFTFLGYAVEYTDGNGSQTERGTSAGNMSARQHRSGSQTARGGQSQRTRLVVIATGLSLNITYEPPSPKFHQQHPGNASYRLKLSKGSESLYSVRGLPHLIRVHPNAYIARWGALELQYSSKQQLDTFTTAVKHVEIGYAPCGQHTARQTAATIRTDRRSALEPRDTTTRPQASQSRSFGSPLPESYSEANESTDRRLDQSDGTAHTAEKAAGAAAKKEEKLPGERSFWTSNFVWITVSVAAVALVTYKVLSTDSSAVHASRPTRARQYKLHVVE